MHPTASWSSRLVLALLALQFASACDPKPPPPPPAPDTAPPSTRATPSGGTFKTNVSVTLLCEDGTGSGCDATYYTTDGSAPSANSTRYSAPVVISQNTPLKFFSVDKSGNAESVQSQSFVVDTVAPTTTATPPGSIYYSAQSVELTCNDGTGTGCAATYYTLDGIEPTASSPRYTTALAIATSTTLKFFSVDNAGNAELVQTANYAINSAIPAVSATPAGGSFRGPQSVTLNCDPGASSATCEAIYYTTDGSTPSTSSATYSAPITVDAATTTLQFFARNSLGNSSPIRTETYRIDGVAPTTTAIPSGRAYKENQSVTLLCEDGTGTGCTATYYTLDGSTPTRTSSTYSAALSISADTTLKFFSVDAAGNEEPVRTETYVIDTVKPTVAAAPAGGFYRSARDITLTCTDNTGGSGCGAIHYTTNGSTPDTGSTEYTAPITLSADTTLKFVAVDKVGNESAVQTEVYTFDAEAPTTTASPTSGTYRTRQTISLTCADSGPSGCEGTYYTLDGSTPTTSSTLYTGPFTLLADTTLKFFSVDKAGNEETARTETYVFDLDTTAPTTTVTPAGGLYTSAQSVTLACADDARGIGCADTYYTLNGSTPTTSSTRYTGPLSLTANTTLKFFSVDKANNEESVRTETYIIATPANVSAQIATIRARANGAISDFIDYALVTYTKPLTGSSDPAGFFLQSEKSGPALFVAVDPTTLSPAPKVGDRVRIRATEKATANGLVQVTRLDTFTVHASGEEVESLVSDVSNVDLVANLDAYESELISVNGTVASTFGTASAGHVSASFVTLGNSTVSTNLRLRLTNAVQDALDVAQDCSVSTRAPLWRFSAQAQPSAWANSDLTLLSCPAPKVTSAAATSSSSVVVNFDRRIDPASVLADGSQFTLDNGLVASSATVSGRQVQLTTTPQVVGTSYKVTVASSVKDTLGSSVSATANSATFDGYVKPARLLINEVNPNISGGKDLLELLVLEGGSVNKMTVTVDGTATPVATMPNVQVETGDIIVVHFAPAAGDVSETTAKDQIKASSYYDTAWDFIGGSSGLTFSHRVLRVRDSANITVDAVPFVVSTSTSPPSAFPGQLQTLQGEGLWFPANCGGDPCSTNTAAVSVSVDYASAGTSATGKSVQRKAGENTRQKSDWVVANTPSFGVPNP
ncbi:MAG TPA: chitobiase/beta-hexosaminidase C-terminal domain-containing protein [Archangium sp.]|uniref:chitobiase/beta-hexosaminidase C-terminal domain-containing protein n=1 Tax=Archangium sp. TaxID=1872627 RepID=UPI002E331EF7|nr:chitobiase/beta-hexosaminidase C-terminal domain-containing protein [Archangium sp.]HEX5753266.1 chitobiase/beta-hexosaminidase C-terminal domain-containing protein [Archangium sp.]